MPVTAEVDPPAVLALTRFTMALAVDVVLSPDARREVMPVDFRGLPLLAPLTSRDRIPA